MTNPSTPTTDTDARVIHFVSDGLAYRVSESPYVAGLVSAVGVEVTLTDDLISLATDSAGGCFWDLADDEEAQRRHWRKVMFRPGRAPAELLERVAAERDAELRERRFAMNRDLAAFGRGAMI